MIAPVESRASFLQELGVDYPSAGRMLKAASTFCPEILIRTNSLNSDFSRLADAGRLNFMNIPIDWQSTFPRDLPPVNSSVSMHADDFYLER